MKQAGGFPFYFGLACRCKDLFVILLNALLERSQDSISCKLRGADSPSRSCKKGRLTVQNSFFTSIYAKIHLQNEHRMLSNGIHIQSPLLQTALKALKNFTFHIVQRKRVGIWFGFFFTNFPLQLLKLYENLCYQKRKKK